MTAPAPERLADLLAADRVERNMSASARMLRSLIRALITGATP